MVREYYEQFYGNTFDDIYEIDQFLEGYKLQSTPKKVTWIALLSMKEMRFELKTFRFRWLHQQIMPNI